MALLDIPLVSVDKYDKQLEQVCKSIQCYNVLVLCLKCPYIVYIDITRVYLFKPRFTTPENKTS